MVSNRCNPAQLLRRRFRSRPAGHRAIQSAIPTIIRFSVSETKPSGTLLSPLIAQLQESKAAHAEGDEPLDRAQTEPAALRDECCGDCHEQRHGEERYYRPIARVVPVGIFLAEAEAEIVVAADALLADEGLRRRFHAAGP